MSPRRRSEQLRQAAPSSAGNVRPIVGKLDQRAEELAAIKAISDEWERARAFAQASSRFTGAERGELLAATKIIDSPSARAHALLGLAQNLTGKRLITAINDAWSAIETIEVIAERALPLANIIGFLPEEKKPEAVRNALTAVEEIVNGYERSSVLSEIARHLPEERKSRVLDEASAAFRSATEAIHAAIESASDPFDEEITESLHLAARYGHVEAVKFLIASGADFDAPQADQCTPLHLAAQYGHPAVAQLLIESGATIDRRQNDGYGAHIMQPNR